MEPAPPSPKLSAARSYGADAAVLAAIGDPARPTGRVPRIHPADSIPGPIGAWSAVRTIIVSFTHGVASATDERLRYGDTYRLRYGPLSGVAVWDPKEILRIFRNEDHEFSVAMGWDEFLIGRLNEPGQNGSGLLSCDFHEHKALRRAVQPAFSGKAVEGYFDTIASAFSRTIDSWVERGQVEFKTAIRRLLAEVSLGVFVGIEDAEEITRLDRQLTHVWGAATALSQNSWLSPAYRRGRRAFQELVVGFEAMVPQRRGRDGSDLFSRMCRSEDALGDSETAKTLVGILLAAFDTTSAATTSMAYLLAVHPEWQERLRTEALELGQGPLTYSQLKELTQLEWVWKETLRLMPINGFLPRQTLRDVEIGGHQVKAGTSIFPMSGAVGRHPDYWSNPTTFDPERFSPERAEDKKHAGAYLPFGGGPHSCIGRQITNLEAKVFWYSALRRFRFRLNGPNSSAHGYGPVGMVRGKVSLTIEPL